MIREGDLIKCIKTFISDRDVTFYTGQYNVMIVGRGLVIRNINNQCFYLDTIDINTFNEYFEIL